MKDKRAFKRKILATVLGVSIGLLLVFNSTTDTYAETQVKTETLSLGDVKHTHVGSASSSPNGCFQNHTRPWAWYSGHGSQHYSHTTCDCGMSTSTIIGSDYGNCNGALNAGKVQTKEPVTCGYCGGSGYIERINSACNVCGGSGTRYRYGWKYTTHSHTSSCVRNIYHSHSSSCYTDHYTSCGVDNGSCGYRYDWYTVNCEQMQPSSKYM